MPGATLRWRKTVAAKGLSALPAYGRDPEGEWTPEDSLLIIGLTEQEACVLGRQHEQNAIVWGDDRHLPNLILLR